MILEKMMFKMRKRSNSTMSLLLPFPCVNKPGPSSTKVVNIVEDVDVNVEFTSEFTGAYGAFY